MREPSHVQQVALSVAWSLFLILVFIGVGSWILLLANGYDLNWRTGTLTQTSAIVLAGQSSSATVTLDGTTVAASLPVTLRNVQLGAHVLQISAPQYQPWHLSVKTSAGQAIIRDRIELFLETPTKVPGTSASVEGSPLIDPTLEVSGAELYEPTGSDRELITRFSSPIVAASRSNDRAHVFVQLGNAVYVTEETGENTTKLLELSSSSAVHLLPRNNDRQLIVGNGTDTVTWAIR